MPAELSTALQCVENSHYLITPAIMTISGVFAIWMAKNSIKSSREIARKQATISLFERSIENELLTNSMNVIRKVHEHNEISIEEYAVKLKDNLNETSFLEVKNAVRKVLNFHEHICIGINAGIYDENVFKEHRMRASIELWNMTEAYIQKRRELSGTKELYENLENQIKRWV